MADGRKLYQMNINYTSKIHCRTLKNIPKFGFLVRKNTIWQPWRQALSVPEINFFHQKRGSKEQQKMWSGRISTS
jgi:hypothetical protein